MYIVENYGLAVALCWVTMLCWGSWGNTQKLAAKTWRYELFYWDYVVGILLFSLIWGFTLGSTGEAGRGFVDDLLQVDISNLVSTFWEVSFLMHPTFCYLLPCHWLVCLSLSP